MGKKEKRWGGGKAKGKKNMPNRTAGKNGGAKQA